MSKRGPDTYLTKDHGSTPNPERKEDSSKMATAAQLAKRRIAQPRSRMSRNAPSNSGTSTPMANPFSSMNTNPQPQQTFGAVNGFTFGNNQAQSQSFPPANSNSTTGSGFNFTLPAANNTFANPFANPSGNNSFTNTNGTAGSSTSFGTAFGQGGDDVSMESPEKKQQTSIFGAQPQSQQPAPSPPLFSFPSSQATSSNPFSAASPFPSQTTQAPTPNGLFGNANKEAEKKDQPPSQSLFGNSNSGFISGQTQQPQTGASSQSSGFTFNGDKPATTPPFVFGQNTETSKLSENGVSTPNKFGGAATTQSSGIFGGGNAPATAPAKPMFNFPGTQTDKPAPASNLFGLPQSDKQAEPKIGGSLFGNPLSSQPQADKPPTTSTPAHSFGSSTPFGAFKPPQEASAEAPKNLFANLVPSSQQAQSAEAAGSLFQSKSLVPASSAELEKPQEEPTRPFSGLFGNQSTTSATGTERQSNSPFTFPGPPSQSGPTSAGLGQPPQPSSLFGNHSKPPSNSSNIFGSFGKPADPTNEAPISGQEGSDAPASNAPDKVSPERRADLFGHLQKPPSPPKQFESIPNPNYREPSGPTEVQAKEVNSLSSPTGMFAASSEPPAASSTNGPPKKRLFDTSASGTALSQPAVPAPISKPAVLTSSVSTPPIAKSTAAATIKPTSTGQVTKKPVFNHPAAGSVPGHLNSEGYKEFDNQDKLRALNRQFRKKIMAVDVATHDIDTILRTYVAARNGIGADIGLYQRTIAGTKRKNDQPEEPPVPSVYKKPRSDGPEPKPSAKPAVDAVMAGMAGNSSVAPSASALQGSALFSGTSQSSKSANLSSGKPAEQQTPSQMLDAMIPPQKSPEKPKNVFEGLKPLSGFSSPSKPAESSTSAPFQPTFGQSSTSTTPSKPTFTFGSSTTPVKSPPKTVGFNPVSGPVTGGFAAFGQKAELGTKKRRAEFLEDEYSSSEEGQASGIEEFEAKERAKKAKYESIPKTGFTPSFGAPASPSKPSPKKNNPFEPDSSGSDKADDEDTSDDKQRDENYEPDEDDREDEGSEEEDEGEEESQEEEEEGEGASHETGEAVVTESSREPSPDSVNKQIAENPNAGRSLFDRISAPLDKAPSHSSNDNAKSPPILNSTTKPGWKPAPMFSGIGKSTPEQPSYSPFTPDFTSKPAEPFVFNPSTKTSADSTSVLGGATAKVDPKFEGLFGSRPSTPNPMDRPSNSLNSTSGDHTWKAGTPIKFGTSTPEKNTDAPKFSFTAPSPSNNDGASETPKPFGSLFGKPAPNSTSKPDGNLGFSFGQASTTPAPGFLSAAPHLGVGGSVTSSAISSRQSSPGLTDNESVATDVTDTEPTAPDDEQAKYNEARAGEEDEELVHEVPTVKALRLANEKTATPKDPKGTWVTLGQGPLRLLRNKDGKTRLVVRNNTNGNIILNEYLQPKLSWAAQPQQKQANGKPSAGAVKGFLAQDGVLNQWVVKLKSGLEGALAEALEKERKAQGSTPSS